MARLIDADALIAWIKGSQQMTSKMKCVIAKIETMPDAVSVVHGKWKRKIVDNGFNADWVCSECGYRIKTDFVDYNFCPNCGARMKGATDGNK